MLLTRVSPAPLEPFTTRQPIQQLCSLTGALRLLQVIQVTKYAQAARDPRQTTIQSNKTTIFATAGLPGHQASRGLETLN